LWIKAKTMARIIKLFTPDAVKVHTFHDMPFMAYKSYTVLMGTDEASTFRLFFTIDCIVVTDQKVTVYYTNGWYFIITRH